MKLLPAWPKDLPSEVEIKAINRVINDFPLFDLACPLSNQVGDRPLDCSFNGYKCNGCSSVKTVIESEVSTFTQLAKWTGEKRYIRAAKVFFALHELFKKGVQKDWLK